METLGTLIQKGKTLTIRGNSKKHSPGNGTRNQAKTHQENSAQTTDPSALPKKSRFSTITGPKVLIASGCSNRKHRPHRWWSGPRNTPVNWSMVIRLNPRACKVAQRMSKNRGLDASRKVLFNLSWIGFRDFWKKKYKVIPTYDGVLEKWETNNTFNNL